MSAELEDKVMIILTSILQIEQHKITLAKRGHTPEWDSMAWVNIIAALEDEFDVELNDDEYELVSSYELICELIKVKTQLI